jgi:hypothetical protein
MPVSLTTPGWSGARNNASVHVAFRETDNVGTRNFQAFAAQWLAYALPYRRFDGTLADAAARLGADAVCYSFIVADFHHLLLAGFAGAPVCKISAPSQRTVVLLEYPSLEVGRNDVAPADDRHDPFAPIAGSVLQYRRNAECGRRLHDKSRMAIEHSHSGNDAVFLNQRYVVGHGQ